MVHLAAKARLEAVEAVHRMRRIRVGRDTEEVVLTAARAPGGLHGAPLERIGGHQVAALGGTGAVEICGAVSREDQEHRGEGLLFMEGHQELHAHLGIGTLHAARDDALEVAPVVDVQAVAVSRLRVEVVPEAERLGPHLADFDALPAGKADVVAGLGLHRGEDLLLGPAQIDHDRVGGEHVHVRLEEVPGGRAVVHVHLLELLARTTAPVALGVEVALLAPVGLPVEVVADRQAPLGQVAPQALGKLLEEAPLVLLRRLDLGTVRKIGHVFVTAAVLRKHQEVRIGARPAAHVGVEVAVAHGKLEGLGTHAQIRLDAGPEGGLLNDGRAVGVGDVLGFDGKLHGVKGPLVPLFEECKKARGRMC